MKKHRIHIDWGTVLGMAVVAVTIYLLATAAGERYARYRAEQRRVYQSTETGSLVEAHQHETPTLSRED